MSPLLPVLVAGALALSGGDAPIHWGERALELSALPPELPQAAGAALAAWHPWAAAHQYRLDLDGAGRLLIVTRASNDRAPAFLERARKVVERFDQELPAPAVRLEAKGPELALPKPAPPKPAAGDQPLPEDPEDPEGGHPWTLAPPRPAQETTAAPVVTSWGAQGQPLDSRTMVLFVLFDEEDFQSLLKELARGFPFLEVWTREAHVQQGFVLGEPLTAAYLENPAGVEEWNPENELVHRTARLCLERRFGMLPNWFVQGYAWHQEIAELGGVFVFPWRDEFVFATEHTGWDDLVRNRFQKTRPKPTDFLSWRRGKYSDPEAKASWAMCEYLLAKERAKLPTILDQLRVFTEEHGRIEETTATRATWRRDTEYEIPLEDQQKLLVQALGADYLERAARFFRKDLGH